MIFPGERTGTKFIEARRAAHGGQQFIVPYDLLDGCHACERVGAADFSFEFDGDGKFLGVKVEGVRTSPGPRGVGLTKPG